MGDRADPRIVLDQVEGIEDRSTRGLTVAQVIEA
jgi:hypothetical protein